jgi:hypothetical protein
MVDYYPGAPNPDGLTYTSNALSTALKALKLSTKLGVQGLTRFHWFQNKLFECDSELVDFVSFVPTFHE